MSHWRQRLCKQTFLLWARTLRRVPTVVRVNHHHHRQDTPFGDLVTVFAMYVQGAPANGARSNARESTRLTTNLFTASDQHTVSFLQYCTVHGNLPL